MQIGYKICTVSFPHLVSTFFYALLMESVIVPYEEVYRLMVLPDAVQLRLSILWNVISKHWPVATTQLSRI